MADQVDSTSIPDPKSNTSSLGCLGSPIPIQAPGESHEVSQPKTSRIEPPGKNDCIPTSEKVSLEPCFVSLSHHPTRRPSASEGPFGHPSSVERAGLHGVGGCRAKPAFLPGFVSSRHWNCHWIFCTFSSHSQGVGPKSSRPGLMLAKTTKLLSVIKAMCLSMTTCHVTSVGLLHGMTVYEGSLLISKRWADWTGCVRVPCK